MRKIENTQLNEMVLRAIYQDEFLSGLADFKDGDVMAINRVSDLYGDAKVVLEGTAEEVFELLKTSQVGIYKIEDRDIVIIDDPTFGTYVYKVDGDVLKFAEHLSVDLIDINKFKKILSEL
jgi:DNA-directed RNA polymerase subunit H (RpoH/RPB5)